jgi:uncharacterized protein YggE
LAIARKGTDMRFAYCGRIVVASVLSASLVARADPPERTVDVTAKAEVRVPPDEVMVEFVVATKSRNLLEAKDANDKKTQVILKLSTAHNIPAEEFKITDLKVSPDFDKDQKLVGYAVDRSFEVVLHDFARLDLFLADLLKSGVEYVNQVAFRLRDQKQALSQARTLAVGYAKEKATSLATLNDMRLGKVVHINEYEQENAGAMGMGGMAFRRGGSRIRGRWMRASPRETSDEELASPEKTFDVRVASLQAREKGVREAQAGGNDNQPNALLAPGQIKIEARVSIRFELLVPQ